MRRVRLRTVRVAVGAFWLGGLIAPIASCMPAGSGTGGIEGGLVPAGYGSLRQDEITLTLEFEAVQIKVTPLTESVIRLAAPDTYSRLAAVRTRAGKADSGASLFLVSLYTEAPGGATFDPHDIQLSSQGSLHRPSDIVALTTEWGAQHLRQRNLQQAIYLFPATVDPWMDLTVQVRHVRNTSWTERIPRLEAERVRVRARAGGAETT